MTSSVWAILLVPAAVVVAGFVSRRKAWGRSSRMAYAALATAPAFAIAIGSNASQGSEIAGAAFGAVVGILAAAVLTNS